ncbi:hypothetical protein PROFUN_06314 [Planoprotostelium fungivorum]|uniref:Ubiquitin-like protease family profile domain-containing protein n=1 Tax=Planoprotostelium fungivorum TaxID=1890364 RepID=A0A2P6NP45_9EUKA|nr:hypothetical protein PROFUN_06314 [Planoprotostelium fungivorum]
MDPSLVEGRNRILKLQEELEKAKEDETEWLSDFLVNLGVAAIQHERKPLRVAEITSSVLLSNPKGNIEEDTGAIKKWLQEINDEKQERCLLMIPWCTGNHWALLVSMRGDRNSMYLLDSYNENPLDKRTYGTERELSRRLFEMMLKNMKSAGIEKKNIKDPFASRKRPQQDGTSCGIYILWFMELLMEKSGDMSQVGGIRKVMDAIYQETSKGDIKMKRKEMMARMDKRLIWEMAQVVVPTEREDTNVEMGRGEGDMEKVEDEEETIADDVQEKEETSSRETISTAAAKPDPWKSGQSLTSLFSDARKETYLNEQMKTVKKFADNPNALYDADVLLILLRLILGDRRDIYIVDTDYRRSPCPSIESAIVALSEGKISFLVMLVNIPGKKDSIGHWMLIIVNAEKTAFFFDPQGERGAPPNEVKEWIRRHIPGFRRYKAILTDNRRMQKKDDGKNCGPCVIYFFEQWLKSGCDVKVFRSEWKKNRPKFEIENYRRGSLVRIQDILREKLLECQCADKPPGMKDSHKVSNKMREEPSESPPPADQTTKRQDQGDELKEMTVLSVLREEAQRMKSYGNDIGSELYPNDPSHKMLRNKIIMHLSCDDMVQYLNQTEEVIKETNRNNKISKLKLAEQYLGYILMYVKLSAVPTFDMKCFYEQIEGATNHNRKMVTVHFYRAGLYRWVIQHRESNMIRIDRMTDKNLRLFYRYEIIQCYKGYGRTRSSPPIGIDQEKMQFLLNVHSEGEDVKDYDDLFERAGFMKPKIRQSVYSSIFHSYKDVMNSSNIEGLHDCSIELETEGNVTNMNQVPPSSSISEEPLPTEPEMGATAQNVHSSAHLNHQNEGRKEKAGEEEGREKEQMGDAQGRDQKGTTARKGKAQPNTHQAISEEGDYRSDRLSVCTSNKRSREEEQDYSSRLSQRSSKKKGAEPTQKKSKRSKKNDPEPNDAGSSEDEIIRPDKEDAAVVDTSTISSSTSELKQRRPDEDKVVKIIPKEVISFYDETKNGKEKENIIELLNKLEEAKLFIFPDDEYEASCVALRLLERAKAKKDVYKGPSTDEVIRACSTYGVAIHLYCLDALGKLHIQIFGVEGEKRETWRIAFCNNFWIPLQAISNSTRLENPQIIHVKDIDRTILWNQVITKGIPTIIEGINDLPEDICVKMPSESQERIQYHEIQLHVDSVMPEFLQYNSVEDAMLWIDPDEYHLSDGGVEYESQVFTTMCTFFSPRGASEENEWIVTSADWHQVVKAFTERNNEDGGNKVYVDVNFLRENHIPFWCFSQKSGSAVLIPPMAGRSMKEARGVNVSRRMVPVESLSTIQLDDAAFERLPKERPKPNQRCTKGEHYAYLSSALSDFYQPSDVRLCGRRLLRLWDGGSTLITPREGFDLNVLSSQVIVYLKGDKVELSASVLGPQVDIARVPRMPPRPNAQLAQKSHPLLTTFLSWPKKVELLRYVPSYRITFNTLNGINGIHPQMASLIQLKQLLDIPAIAREYFFFNANELPLESVRAEVIPVIWLTQTWRASLP